MVFFFLSVLVCRLQAMYLLFSFSMACLYVGEVVFVAYVGIKEGVDQGVVALILVLITLVWHWSVSTAVITLRRTMVLRTHGLHNNVYI